MTASSPPSPRHPAPPARTGATAVLGPPEPPFGSEVRSVVVVGAEGAGWRPAGRPRGRGRGGAGGAAASGGRGLPDGAQRVELGPVEPALHRLAGRRAVVLASGDPGFFGIVRVLRERGAPRRSCCRRRPAWPPLFARLGPAWDDAAVVSAHGRALRPAVNVCRARPKVAVLTAPGAGPAELGRRAARLRRARSSWPRTWAGRRSGVVTRARGRGGRPGLGCRSTSCSACATRTRCRTGAGTAGGEPVPAAGGWALPDDDVRPPRRDDHQGRGAGAGAGPARAAARRAGLGRRRRAPARSPWSAPGSAPPCIAVERDPTTPSGSRRNAAAHGVRRRGWCTARRPAALAGLPQPGRRVRRRRRAGRSSTPRCAARPPARLVVALAALDRVGAGPRRAAGRRLRGRRRAAPRPGSRRCPTARSGWPRPTRSFCSGASRDGRDPDR